MHAALTANGLIFCAKMTAWLFTGGSALLAEAIHSVADVGNQAMLRVGIAKAARAPTKEFPYGHLRDKFIFRCAHLVLFTLRIERFYSPQQCTRPGG